MGVWQGDCPGGLDEAEYAEIEEKMSGVDRGVGIIRERVAGRFQIRSRWGTGCRNGILRENAGKVGMQQLDGFIHSTG